MAIVSYASADARPLFDPELRGDADDWPVVAHQHVRDCVVAERSGRGNGDSAVLGHARTNTTTLVNGRLYEATPSGEVALKQRDLRAVREGQEGHEDNLPHFNQKYDSTSDEKQEVVLGGFRLG